MLWMHAPVHAACAGCLQGVRGIWMLASGGQLLGHLTPTARAHRFMTTNKLTAICCHLPGVNVWTHGELLPAHGYPELKKKFPHLVGNFGGAWYAQQREFAEFPGPILVSAG